MSLRDMINSAQIVIISNNKSAKKTGTLANLQLFIADAHNAMCYICHIG